MLRVADAFRALCALRIVACVAAQTSAVAEDPTGISSSRLCGPTSATAVTALPECSTIGDAAGASHASSFQHDALAAQTGGMNMLQSRTLRARNVNENDNISELPDEIPVGNDAAKVAAGGAMEAHPAADNAGNPGAEDIDFTAWLSASLGALSTPPGRKAASNTPKGVDEGARHGIKRFASALSSLRTRVFGLREHSSVIQALGIVVAIILVLFAMVGLYGGMKADVAESYVESRTPRPRTEPSSQATGRGINVSPSFDMRQPSPPARLVQESPALGHRSPMLPHREARPEKPTKRFLTRLLPRSDSPPREEPRRTEYFCTDLVVPEQCTCQLVVPLRPRHAGGPIEILDVDGSIVLRVVPRGFGSQTSGNQADLSVGDVNRVVLTTADGGPLAQCCPAKDHGAFQFHLLRSQGDFFAKLVRNEASGAYELVAITGATLHFHGNFRQLAITITDNANKVVATTERRNVAFDDRGEYYYLKAESLADVGLVLCALLCINHFDF